jgi:hypothetical protein
MKKLLSTLFLCFFSLSFVKAEIPSLEEKFKSKNYNENSLVSLVTFYQQEYFEAKKAYLENTLSKQDSDFLDKVVFKIYRLIDKKFYLSWVRHVENERRKFAPLLKYQGYLYLEKKKGDQSDPGNFYKIYELGELIKFFRFALISKHSVSMGISQTPTKSSDLFFINFIVSDGPEFVFLASADIKEKRINLKLFRVNGSSDIYKPFKNEEKFEEALIEIFKKMSSLPNLGLDEEFDFNMLKYLDSIEDENI